MGGALEEWEVDRKLSGADDVDGRHVFGARGRGGLEA